MMISAARVPEMDHPCYCVVYTKAGVKIGDILEAGRGLLRTHVFYLQQDRQHQRIWLPFPLRVEVAEDTVTRQRGKLMR